jgi:hypothetical protein
MKNKVMKLFLIVLVFVMASASLVNAEFYATPPPLGLTFGLTLHPDPGSVNVPLDTDISFYTMRLGLNETGTLKAVPDIEIKNVTTKYEHGNPPRGGWITFYPAKLLRPNTVYNVTVTRSSGLVNRTTGMTIGHGPEYSWQFTTTAETPRAAPGFGIAITVMAIILGIGGKYFRKKE